MNPKHFIQAGKHLFNEEEERKIREKTEDAIMYIRGTDEMLYQNLVQVVACIGYYRAAIEGHLGGTIFCGWSYMARPQQRR